MRRTVFISLAEFPLLDERADHIDYSITDDDDIEFSNSVKKELRRGPRDVPQNIRLTGHYQNDEASADPVPAFRKLSISESLGALGGNRTDESIFADRTSTYSQTMPTATPNSLEYHRGTPNVNNIRKSSPLPPTTRRSAPSPNVHPNVGLQSGIRRSIDVSTSVDRSNYGLNDNRRINISNRGTPLHSDRMSSSTMDTSPSLVTLDDQRHDLEMRRILAKREERRRLSEGEQSRMSTPEVHLRQQRTPNMMSSSSFSSRPDLQRRPSVPMQNDSSRRSTPMINRVSPAVRITAPDSSERRAAELWNRMVSEGNH